jgi:hypothetical protein
MSSRDNVVEAFVRGVPEASRGIVARAFAGTSSPRQAIKAMCLTCTHFDRAEVADCRVFRCPLWTYRPYQPEAEKLAGSARGGGGTALSADVLDQSADRRGSA